MGLYKRIKAKTADKAKKAVFTPFRPAMNAMKRVEAENVRIYRNVISILELAKAAGTRSETVDLLEKAQDKLLGLVKEADDALKKAEKYGL